jgi:myo-inositol 2-dehydrogenase / D-chiro-inositol 1-dehydrogenase
MNKKMNLNGKNLTRRDFVKVSSYTAGGLMLSSLPLGASAYAAGSDKLKLALIGCGRRGTGAAVNALNADEGVELVTMVDILPDRMEESYNILLQRFGDSDQLNVAQEHKFIGFDKYREAIALADLVILATPTYFRPLHFEEVARQGKHVFMEKPMAVDAAGIRRVMDAGKVAMEKQLNVVVGLQRRYQTKYREVHRRMQNGEIGEILSAQIYWNQGGSDRLERQSEWSELEFQIRNQNRFLWTSGGQVLDQLIHNIDVANWFIGAHPVSAHGMFGMEIHNNRDHGQFLDHHNIEFTYPGGLIVSAECRRIPNVYNLVAERMVGTKGSIFTQGFGSDAVITDRQNRVRYNHEGENDPNPYQVEFDELIAPIRAGNVIDDTESGIHSSMSAILGLWPPILGSFSTGMRH